MLEILADQAAAARSSVRLIRANPIDTRPSGVGLKTRCTARAYEGVSLGTVKVRSDARRQSQSQSEAGFVAPLQGVAQQADVLRI